MRRRLEQLKAESPLLSFGKDAADRIAWGVLQRVGGEMSSFAEPLADALATDSDSFGKLFHYEILAAFAAHGIKLEPGIAVMKPQHFVLDGRVVNAGNPGPNLLARGYLGENTGYIAEFSTHPTAFGALNLFQRPDRTDPEFNYIKINSIDPGTPVPQTAPADTDEGGLNHFVDLEVPYADLELLTHGDDSIRIFMHLTTYGPGTYFSFSHIEGAGQILSGAEHPFTIYNATSAPADPPGCAVADPVTPSGVVIALLWSMGVGAFVLVRRRER